MYEDDENRLSSHPSSVGRLRGGAGHSSGLCLPVHVGNRSATRKEPSANLSE